MLQQSPSSKDITKTCLYNFDPLKPHFYLVKLGFTEVNIIFLISAQKYRLWVLVRTAEAVLMSTHNLCFEQKYEKYQNFLSEIFHFLVVKFSLYLNRDVFVMVCLEYMSREDCACTQCTLYTFSSPITAFVPCYVKSDLCMLTLDCSCADDTRVSQ